MAFFLIIGFLFSTLVQANVDLSKHFKPNQRKQFLGVGSCHVHAATSIIENFCYRALLEMGVKGYKHINLSEAYSFIFHLNKGISEFSKEKIDSIIAKNQRLFQLVDGGHPSRTLESILVDSKFCLDEQCPMTAYAAEKLEHNINLNLLESIEGNNSILNYVTTEEYRKKIKADPLISLRVKRGFELFDKCRENKFSIYAIPDDIKAFPLYGKQFLDQNIPMLCSKHVHYRSGAAGAHSFIVAGYDKQPTFYSYRVRDSNSIWTTEKGWIIEECEPAIVMLTEKEVKANKAFLDENAVLFIQNDGKQVKNVTGDRLYF